MDSRVLKGHGFTNREEILVRTVMSKGTTSVVPLSPPFISHEPALAGGTNALTFTNGEKTSLRIDMSKGTTSVVPISPPFISHEPALAGGTNALTFTNGEKTSLRIDMSKGTTSVVPLSPSFSISGAGFSRRHSGDFDFFRSRYCRADSEVVLKRHGFRAAHEVDLKGHGFSRAATSAIMKGALAPEGDSTRSGLTATPHEIPADPTSNCPQRLKPLLSPARCGTAEAVPFQSRRDVGTAEAVPLLIFCAPSKISNGHACARGEYRIAERGKA